MLRKYQQFTNNASGNLNKNKQINKHKQINFDELDVQMVSPNFLQSKTLKKPFAQYGISLSKTNPQGLSNYHHSPQYVPTKDNTSAVNFKKQDTKVQKRDQQPSFSVLDASGLNIKPAYKRQSTEKPKFSSPIVQVIQKDKNTIFSAIMRKGLKPEVAIKPQVVFPQEQKKLGPAQAKLKAMINRQMKLPIDSTFVKSTITKKKETKKDIQPDQIGEQIAENFDQYGNEQFQKLSGVYESAIKQSIAGESNIIKESIRESIRQSINSSGSMIKESIKEDIRQNFASSSRSLKEEIIQEISASKGKSKQSIQEVYQQIFQDQSLSNSHSKSQNRFKKSQNLKQMDLSASKSFRMKTNVVKSLKYAEQLGKKEKQALIPKINDQKMVQEISKQKDSLKKLHQKISNLMKKQKQSLVNCDKNKDLYYNFKVQLNRLIASQNFESKLRKLVSFMSIGSDITPNQKYVDQLQDNILKNVMFQIENIKIGKKQVDEIQKLKLQYDRNLKEKLKIQQINLRAEMNQKLSQKDFELKKMIAELQSRMMNRTFQRVQFKDNVPLRGQQYQVQSDYSIDSDNVSWKADLWELLPEYQKKKLYDQQSAQVTKFLTDIMVNELQEQALQRSIDISFQFPEEYNSIPLASYEPSFKSEAKIRNSGFSQKSKDKEANPKNEKSQFLSDLPKLNVKKSNELSDSNISANREDLELKYQKVRKDEKIKPEIIKILAQYKQLYLKKKQETIKNFLKLLFSRDNEVQSHTLSSIIQMSILSERQVKKQHKVYIKAYQQELLMSLLAIYNKSISKKPNSLEQQMKKMYDRLVVVCQVSISEKCVQKVALDVEKDICFNVEVLTKKALNQMQQAPCAIQIIANENYMQHKVRKEEKNIKDEVVKHIVNILTAEFAKEFPKRK